VHQSVLADREAGVGVELPELHRMPTVAAVAAAMAVVPGVRIGRWTRRRARLEPEDLAGAVVPALAAHEQADDANTVDAARLQLVHGGLQAGRIGHAPGDLERLLGFQRRQRGGGFLLPVRPAAPRPRAPAA